MKLAIDIGNTQIKLGVFDNTKLIDCHSFNNDNEINNQFSIIKNNNFSTAIISSVVPALTQKYQKAILKLLKINPFIINHKNCNIKLSVPNPDTVGTDRICNVVAAQKKYPTPLIIIDFGTATTYDVVNIKGDFVGGVIAPGVRTSAAHLIEKAALLSAADLKFPKNVIGDNTKNNIQSGVMFGAIDQVSGMIHRINKETKIQNNIILTGGFANVLSSELSMNHIVDTNLTLNGMIYINESNN